LERKKTKLLKNTDVLVIGAGNAAMCSALAARENGADVKVLEAASIEDRGGNSTYTAGAMRVVFNSIDDLKKIMDLSEEEILSTDFGTYTFENYFDDMSRVTQFKADPDMVETLVSKSHETLVWMRQKGVRFQPSYGRQAFKVQEKFKFWGGLAVEAWGGGPGLVDGLHQAALKEGINVKYGVRAVTLLRDDKTAAVIGVRCNNNGIYEDFYAKAVILACGGFESNAEWRTRYLGPGWDLAKVRGTRHNMGDGIKMALDVGAMPYGNWSGCHSVAWDQNAPEFGDLSVGDGFQKHSYPFSVMINANGKRFLDEGADFRNYTYAKYGRIILEQPGQFAWQVFDSKVKHLQRDEYRIKQVTKIQAQSLNELAEKMDGVEAGAFIKTINEFNSAVQRNIKFDPNIKDGKSTNSLRIPKSNWANTIDKPPFEAFQVTCGITFTFGGLKVDGQGRVLNVSGDPIEGLFAAGELLGGLFYFNYPGGTGLTSGAVFGKIAGSNAGSLKSA
tara:strand:- start:27127 stop:28635 length:1509 start_codon:yes stop_codon:yes gene_type:complete